MLLKKITLNNIRSYKEVSVEFPEGSVLLSGDIGSGKTSILLGIEFALFGLQPGQKGISLLRSGENEGFVKLQFEVNGKEIILERVLKRKKSITQDYCSITIDGEKKEPAVTELKNLVLELLSYPEEFAKKQNLLYRFTVYTPQEEMKQILLQDVETRLNTLRHVFGVDKYKRIIENASIIASKIREEKRRKEGVIESLEEDKTRLIEKEEETETKNSNLFSIEKELFLKTEIRKKVLEEQQEIANKIKEKKELENEVEKTNIMIMNKRETMAGNIKTLNGLKYQISELEKLHFEESLISEMQKQIDLIKTEKDSLNEQNLKITSTIASLTLKNEDNQKTRQKISSIEICPTCLQDVDSVYKSNVINKLDSNTADNNNQLKLLRAEKEKVLAGIKSADSQIASKQRESDDLKLLRVKLHGIDEKRERLQDIEKNNRLLEKDIELLNEHLQLLKTSVFELRKFDNIFEIKQKEIELALKEERGAEIKVAELKKEIDVFSRQINELKERINYLEEVKVQMNYLTELENWLSKKFLPLISFIETNVMIKLKSEFSELFNRWFCMLVSDSFNVKLDNNFTPIIEQQDYEIEYEYLSGGERTAVALAYRLALNQVINSFLSKINTKDLVILDEPTDGFSEQQLDKMRDVLQQLNVKQLILVSHEAKIESFVENIIRFKKDGGVTRVEK
ncbi:MAG: AAA family ATPase, partial [Nanoarchaeota archaeon]|nr:AAA family ATPase [Nanoarchaeota archaeon]